MTTSAKVYIPADNGPPPSQPRKKRRGRRPLYTKVAKRGRRSREKGAAFEREVATLAKEHGFDGAKRAAPMQAAGYARDYSDVVGVGRLRIECKRRASGSLAAGREHVEGEEVPGFVNVAACRDDHGEALAVLRLVDLLKLEAAALSLVNAPCGSWDAAERADREAADALTIPKQENLP